MTCFPPTAEVNSAAKHVTIQMEHKLSTQEHDMVYRGHVRNGKVELDHDAPLPEGAEVDITLRETQERHDHDGPTFYDTLKPFIGTVADLPEDFSVNHDHYLYGAPKRQ